MTTYIRKEGVCLNDIHGDAVVNAVGTVTIMGSVFGDLKVGSCHRGMVIVLGNVHGDLEIVHSPCLVMGDVTGSVRSVHAPATIIGSVGDNVSSVHSGIYVCGDHREYRRESRSSYVSKLTNRDTAPSPPDTTMDDNSKRPISRSTDFTDHKSINNPRYQPGPSNILDPTNPLSPFNTSNPCNPASPFGGGLF